MRKTTIRHIVHGILDLLPLFVIPVFAIYARNENAQFGYEVTEEVNKVVDFNQQINMNESSVSSYGLEIYKINQTLQLNGQATNVNTNYIGYTNSIHFDLNHIYLIKSVSTYESKTGTLTFYLNYPFVQISQNGYTRFTFTNTNPNNANQQLWLLYNSTLNVVNFEMTQNIFDLTKMFGSGNEPTNEQFDIWFNEYYSYTESQEVIIENYETITYNDTDIGSQMIYTLYNTVDKYFNMNNVFNMNQVYQWFEINIFGGTAPLAIYIVWNIVLYEFVMDLLMLLYALFMFFIDMCKKLMEKPLTSIK